MKWILACGLAILPTLNAEEAGGGDSEEQAQGFDVNGLIAAPVAALAKPSFLPEAGEPGLLVFSNSLEAQEHVRQGFALIHASWDFEAYRHFCAAVQADSQCLMAYCGMVLSLTNPQHEFHEQRARAYNRMLTLAEFKVDGEFYYPENERMYAVGVAELIANGVVNSVRVFRQLAKDYPNDIQAKLLATFLGRGGYNALGNPRLAQREAIATFRKLSEQLPQDPMVANFLVMVQAEAPYQAVDFKGELLPLAEQLIELSEGKVPSWYSLLGYIAMRSGEVEKSEAAYKKAIEGYVQWQERDGVGLADNEGRLRCELSLAALYLQQKNYKKADSLIAKVNAYQFPKEREYSNGALTQKWYGKLMPFKSMMEQGRYKEARKVLPAPLTTERRSMDPYSAIIVAYQLYCDAVELIEADDNKKARVAHGKLALMLAEMQSMQSQVANSYEFADFIRALSSLVTLHKELTALVSEGEGLASNWFKSAIESQQVGSRILPPDILYPVEFRYGRYLVKKGEKEEAKEVLGEALKRRPCYVKSRDLAESLGE
ncbi:tetratricopeptide repeat protein [Rubritalea tangerina]|uniref:Tetratricopeptide repeat protein n=1 Tax=Rubritalea tangerina TaxID=430798 RepID=A0ABW4Z8X0_9BACT